MKTVTTNHKKSDIPTYTCEFKSYEYHFHRVLVSLLAGLFFMGICFGCSSFIGGITASAQTEEQDYKYYTSVQIAHGETLFSIAERYYAVEYYDDMDEYLKEVCRTNHIDDRDSLRAGDYIIMPYYATYVAAQQ